MGPIGLSLGAAKYVGLPLAAGAGAYALNMPHRGERETLKHQVGRMSSGWTVGGGLAGGLAGQALARGGSVPMRLGGALLGMGAGAALGHEYGTPFTARHAMKSRISGHAYPQGVDPRTGLPIWLGYQPAVSPEELQRKYRWGV